MLLRQPSGRMPLSLQQSWPCSSSATAGGRKHVCRLMSGVYEAFVLPHSFKASASARYQHLGSLCSWHGQLCCVESRRSCPSEALQLPCQSICTTLATLHVLTLLLRVDARSHMHALWEREQDFAAALIRGLGVPSSTTRSQPAQNHACCHPLVLLQCHACRGSTQCGGHCKPGERYHSAAVQPGGTVLLDIPQYSAGKQQLLRLALATCAIRCHKCVTRRQQQQQQRDLLLMCGVHEQPCAYPQVSCCCQ
jgi:hypothetical protein